MSPFPLAGVWRITVSSPSWVNILVLKRRRIRGPKMFSCIFQMPDGVLCHFINNSLALRTLKT